MAQEQIKAKVATAGKIMCTLTTIACFGSFVMLRFYEYLFLLDDHPIEKFPSIRKYTHINICYLNNVFHGFCQISENGLKLLFNVLIIIGYWSYQLVMNRHRYRKIIMKRFPEFIFIEKPMVNILSNYIGMFIFSNYQPLNFQFSVVFPNEFGIIFALTKLLGYILLVKSIFDSRKQFDMFGIEFMASLWGCKKQYITYEEKYESKNLEDNICQEGLYRRCRYPEIFSMILIYGFSGLIVNFDKILFCMAMIIGKGFLLNEKQVENDMKFKNLLDYKIYKMEVSSLVVPSLCLRKKDESKTKEN